MLLENHSSEVRNKISSMKPLRLMGLLDLIESLLIGGCGYGHTSICLGRLKLPLGAVSSLAFPLEFGCWEVTLTFIFNLVLKPHGLGMRLPCLSGLHYLVACSMAPAGGVLENAGAGYHAVLANHAIC